MISAAVVKAAAVMYSGGGLFPLVIHSYCGAVKTSLPESQYRLPIRRHLRNTSPHNRRRTRQQTAKRPETEDKKIGRTLDSSPFIAGISARQQMRGADQNKVPRQPQRGHGNEKMRVTAAGQTDCIAD